MYTGKGDQGQSTLYTGQKMYKDDPYFDALGSIDELNSHIGYVPTLN